MCPGVESDNRVIARNAAWHWSAIRRGRRLPKRFTPARCTRRCSRTNRAIAPSAGWRWNRRNWRQTPKRNRTKPDMARRFWIGAALSLPVLVLAMAHFIPGLDLSRWIPPRVQSMDSIRLEHAGGAVGGLAFLRAGLALRRHAEPEHVHAHRPRRGRGLSVQLSWRCSSRNFLPAPIAQHGEVPVYFEAAAIITVLVLLGQMLEARARSRTSSAIRALLEQGGRSPLASCATARKWRFPSPKFRRVTCSACVPERKCPWTAWSRKAAAAVDESMITGEVHASGKTSRRARHRRDGEPNRFVPHASREGWQRNRSLTNREDGFRRATQPRADSAPRRQSFKDLRARRHRSVSRDVLPSGFSSAPSRDWPTRL